MNQRHPKNDFVPLFNGSRVANIILERITSHEILIIVV